MGLTRVAVALAGGLALTVAGCGDDGSDLGGWAMSFGGIGTDAPTAIAPAANGGVVLSGLFSATASAGDVQITSTNAWDAFVLMVDDDGTAVWAERLGGAGNDIGQALAVDTDGSVVVVGSFAEKVTLGDDTRSSLGGTDGFVARLDADGSAQWLVSFGGVGEDLGRAVAIAADGDILIAGEFMGTAGFDEMLVQSEGESDAFYARLAPDGTPRWAKRLGGRGFDNAYALAAAPDGGFAIAGQFEGNMQVGDKEVVSKGFFDVYVSGFDTDGAPRWTRSFGDVDDDFVRAATIGANGTLAITGDGAGSLDFGTGALTTDGTDAYVATYASDSGVPGWSRLLAGAGFGSGQDVAIDVDGNVDVAGAFSESLAFDACSATSIGANDVVVTRFDPAGACVWLQRFGGTGDDSATAIAVGADSPTPAIAGTFQDTGNFAYAALASAGARDIFVLTLPQ